MSEPLLVTENLRTWFPIKRGIFRRTVGHVRAVDGVSLEINRGETLALVGESGCGKTTVGKTILRLIEATGGSVRYEGEEILALDQSSFHPYRRKLQIVMQDPASALDPRMTVRNAIAEGLHTFGLVTGEDAVTERVAELMRLVSLDPDTMHRYPHEFSGGQRQRICVARALAPDPDLIVCDEAISALDVSIQAQILNLLEKLQKDRGLTFLFITHDLNVVRYFADRVAIMYLGRIVETGPTERIFETPRHPYTRALIASAPSVDPDHRGVEPAALGDVPSPANPPSGCHYHPRCLVRIGKCDKKVPEARVFSDGISRCFLAVEDGIDEEQDT